MFSRFALVLLAGTTLFSLIPGRAVEAPQVLNLWPGTAPGEIGNIGPEMFWLTRPDGKPIPPVAGKPVKWLTNVSKPTLTVYRPSKDKDTGAAMVICPGGGLTYLAWDSEGEEVAAWLNSIGITGIILKYRVPRRPDQMNQSINVWLLRPLQDAQRAISVVRSQTGAWGVDPRRIGIIGFSAGAALAALTSTNFDKRSYDAVDAADAVSCRPDFAVQLYNGGGALPSRDKTHYELAPNFTYTKTAPPTFFAAAGDDGDKAEIAICMYLALKQAGVPAELHLYSVGGHDFGLRPSPHPCSTWPQRCVEWLQTLGVLKTPAGR